MKRTTIIRRSSRAGRERHDDTTFDVPDRLGVIPAAAPTGPGPDDEPDDDVPGPDDDEPDDDDLGDDELQDDDLEPDDLEPDDIAPDDVLLLDDAGQATTEYALVLLGAALVALLLIGWATAGGGAGKIGHLLDHVLDTITSKL